MTSTGELLDQAQRQAWDLAQQLPVEVRDRKMAAREVARIHLQAWPALAGAGARALRATWGPGESYLRYQDAIVALEGTQDRTAAHPAPVDPRFARITATLDAVADLSREPFHQSGWTQGDQAAYRDKIGAVLETAARLTRGYVEASGTVNKQQALRRPSVYRGIVAFAEAMEAATTTHPAHRAGALDDLGIPDPRNDLQNAVAQWHVSAAHHFNPKVAAAAPRLLEAFALDAAVISRALATSFAAAARGQAIDQNAADAATSSFAAAAGRWNKAAEAWKPIRGGAGGTPEHYQAGLRLHRAIAARFRDDNGWTPSKDLAASHSLPQLAQLAGEARWISQQLSDAMSTYTDLARLLVDRGAILVTGAEIRNELREASHGPAVNAVGIDPHQYMPVPRSVTAVPVIRSLLTAAESARAATTTAQTAAATTARTPAETWNATTTRASGIGLTHPPYWSDPPMTRGELPPRDDLDEAREALVYNATRHTSPEQRLNEPSRQADAQPSRRHR